jgi:hypothetical protein
MEVEKLLDLKVSYQDHFWTGIKETTLKSVLDEIKGEKHSRFTNYLRKLYFSGDKENYGIHKRKLPVVTFCGFFEIERTKDFLKEYNYLIVLDIDKLGKSELNRIKQALFKDRIVFSFWESPSKDGIKGLVHLKYNFEIVKYGVDYSHKVAFGQLIKYFMEKHNIALDRSGSDITRLCFVSWDKILVLKEKIVSFEVENISMHAATIKKTQIAITKSVKNVRLKDILYNPNGKNNQYHRKTIKNIIKYLTKNDLSITHSYEEWLGIAFAISSSFTYDIGSKYFIELCKLDEDKFNENECKNFLINCYEYSRGKIGFSTIMHFASEKGFKIRKNVNAEST